MSSQFRRLSLIGHFRYTPSVIDHYEFTVPSLVADYVLWIHTSYFRCFAVSGHFEYAVLLQYRILQFFS